MPGKAVKLYKNAIRYTQNDSGIYSNLGNLLSALGKSEEAKEHTKKGFCDQSR